MDPGVCTWDSPPDLQAPRHPPFSTDPRNMPTFRGTFPSLQGQDGFGWDQKRKGTSLEQRQPGRKSTEQQGQGRVGGRDINRETGREGHRERGTERTSHRDRVHSGTRAGVEQREIIQAPDRTLIFGGAKEERNEATGPQPAPLPSQHHLLHCEGPHAQKWTALFLHPSSTDNLLSYSHSTNHHVLATQA